AGMIAWTKRITAELLAGPVKAKLDAQAKALDELAGIVGDLGEEFFSREEAEAIRTRLDALEEKLKADVATKEENQAAREKRIAAIERDIEILKAQVESLPRNGFVRA